jgi:hypothetical protein
LAKSSRTTLTSQIGTFSAIPVRVLERCRDSAGIHLYAWLARYANQERRAWPGQTRLAKDMGCSIRSMQRALEALKASGVVTTVPLRDKGVIIGTEYVLVFPLEAVEIHTPPVTDRPPTQADSTRQTYTPPVSPLYKEELDPLEPEEDKRVVYTNPKHPHRYPVFWCGQIFCVSQDQHFKFTQRMQAAGVNPDEMDWPDWYAKKDLEWGETDIMEREPKGPMFWLAVKLGTELDALRQAS